MNTLDDLTLSDLDEINSRYKDELLSNNLNEEECDLQDILNSHCSLSTKSIFALKELIKNIPNGEVRPQQLILISRVSDVIEDRNDGLMQAGTGVGKSIAYLIPAIISKRKCIISTSTKQLTSQLTEKDLPLLKKYLFKDMNFIGLQSLTNYICPRKMVELLDEVNKDEAIFMKTRPDEHRALKKAVSQYDSYLRNEIRLEDFTTDNMGFSKDCDYSGFTCSGSACVRPCKFTGKDSCPVNRIVMKALQSDVVVTNHAYISRMIVQASKEEDKKLGILRDRYLWICDEAHDLEGYMERAFSTELSTGDLKYNYLDKLQKYVNQTLIEDTFSSECTKYFSYMESNFPDIDKDLLYQTGDDIKSDTIKLGRIIGDIYNIVSKYKEAIAESRLEMLNEGKTSRLIEYLEERFEFEYEDIKKFKEHISTLITIKSRLETLDCVNVKYVPTIKSIATDILDAIKTFYLAYSDKESYITYFQYIKPDRDNQEPFRIFATYLKTGDALQAGLGYLDLDKSDLIKVNNHRINMIGVSATLCVDNSFRDMADKLGMLKLKDIKCSCHDVGTVFNYREQCLMYAPQNIPSVKGNSKEHSEFFHNSIKELIELSGGGALILCTSKKETIETYNYLKNVFGNKYTVLCAESKEWKDKNKNKNTLVKTFRDDKDSILVGTRGFFQGLDVQGDSLRLLCLNKLPFGVPGVLSERKSEIAKSKGLDAFKTTATVPATMILLQAIGRLIRHTSDRGVVAIYDDRLYKGVGWLSPLVRSLPPFTVTNDIEDVEKFFTK